MILKSQIIRILALLLLLGLCMPAFVSCARMDSLLNEPIHTASAPDNTPVQTPALTAEPTPEPKDIIYQAFVDAFREELFLINNDTLEFGYNDASDIIASIQRYVLKHALLPELMEISAQAALNAARELYPGREVTLTESFKLPDWQYLAAALPFVTDSADVIRILGVSVTVKEGGGGITLTLTSEAAPIREFAEERANAQEDESLCPNEYLDVRFTYAYLKAVYDENGEERADFNTFSYPFEESYIGKLTWPLTSYPWFDNSWAKPRSHNTRAHMGTDIKMPENTPIFSCSDGTVLYKGTADIPGNYVLIIDDKGFEYHYYHMSKLSEWVEVGERVQSGQQVGDVGNTGNSDAPHLHISIISPEGEFLNPYDLMITLKEKAQRRN